MLQMPPGPVPTLPYKAVAVQTLWTEKKSIAYFVVQRQEPPGPTTQRPDLPLDQLYKELDRLEAGKMATRR